MTFPGLKGKRTQLSLEKRLLGVLLIQRNPFGSKSIWIGKSEELRLGGRNLMESLSIKGKAGKRRKGKGIFKGIFKFIFKGMSSSEQFPPCFIILPQKFPLSLGFSSKFQGQGDPLLPHCPVTKFPLFLGFSPKIPRPRGGQEKKKNQQTAHGR